jgi:hypothetical protein
MRRGGHTVHVRPPDAPGRRGQLRAGLVRLGGYIGWDAPTVARFSQTMTGRPWRHCGINELEQVLAVFAEASARVRAKIQANSPDRCS